MNVSQLIEALQSMPPQAEVLHLWDGEARTTIQIVYLAKNGSVVTSDYSEVCYTTECRPLDAPTEEEDRYWQTADNPAYEEEEEL